ncbi:hypothetical protein Q6A51_18995 [Pseudomonas sp. KFB-139]|uniref:Lipoprotein n=1 Tax=Pseudomonas serbiensis TaxID=3064350 RepID=A0ABT9CUK6_9PSED|nr:hypothetical protein [Pseudomonas sp. KFB-138]MDO7928879.1 hypothetical protein [Pseudomonas sp. KFB-138]
MSNFSQLRVLGAVTAFAILLSGCGINGTYPDFNGPDAAKLRYISKLESATLDVFDTEHCDGQTTGLMNNLFVANTSRRAGMSIPPQEGIKAYYELKLKPGHELFLRTNTLTTGTVCGTSFNFTPQSGAEYELTFNYAGNQCQAVLNRLHQLNGTVTRSPIPLVYKGLPSCTGSNAIFPKPVEAQPSTPERTALIDQIIKESLTEEMKVTAVPADQLPTAEKLDKAVNDRKQFVTITLPDAYWAEYRQNVQTFANDVNSTKERSLKFYNDFYRTQLERQTTEDLKVLTPGSKTANLTRLLLSNNEMLQYYNRTTREVMRQNLSDNLNRMADLDKRYGVCERFINCWKN